MEPGPELTKVQQNELYKSIEDGGLDPAECDLTHIYKPERVLTQPVYSILPFRRNIKIGEERTTLPGSRNAQIKHLPSGSLFDIKISMFRQYKPADSLIPYYFYESFIAGERRSNGTDWQRCLDGARKWSEIVKRECVDPDLWEELRRKRTFLGRARQEDLANTSFTTEERAEIADQLKEIEESVKRACSLSAEQAEYVERRFDEVKDASHRLGRKDWLLLFGGVLFSLILSAVVPPEVVQHILTMAAQGMSHLFGAGAPPGLPS